MTVYWALSVLERGRRRDTWDFLRSVARDINLPWCICGGFNDVLFEHEKVGVTDKTSWLINGFQQAVAESNLTHVKMMGYHTHGLKVLVRHEKLKRD